MKILLYNNYKFFTLPMRNGNNKEIELPGAKIDVFLSYL